MTELPGELSCREMVELVNDYLEGALPPDDESDFERHLVFCDGCAEYLKQMRQLGRTAARLREDEVPREVQDSLLDAFRGWKKGHP